MDSENHNFFYHYKLWPLINLVNGSDGKIGLLTTGTSPWDESNKSTHQNQIKN